MVEVRWPVGWAALTGTQASQQPLTDTAPDREVWGHWLNLSRGDTWPQQRVQESRVCG